MNSRLFPSFENILRLKQPATSGELFLLEYLDTNLPTDIEIYFQPYLNTDRPDIILIQKNIGATIIEVKDWNHSSYSVNEKRNWILKSDGFVIKSPFAQVFTYKENLFNIHIGGLLEAKLKNFSFYNRINVFVYFHNINKHQLQGLYGPLIESLKEKMNSFHTMFRTNALMHANYDKQCDMVSERLKKIERDLKLSVARETLKNIKLPSNDHLNLFTDQIYNEFKRYLQPPNHVLEQGVELVYTAKQKKLIESKNEYKKISGVAGSGKTTVLAKRAVNAHLRHGSQVLILTYNITLKSFIHDKISQVRENFNWNNFQILNYHTYIAMLLNHLNISIEVDYASNLINQSDFLERHYFGNTSLFSKLKNKIPKFKSIFIDEVQDYKPEWIKILRDCVLDDDGEMVLFCDPMQNVYQRQFENKMPVIIQGFGLWDKLNKSLRFSGSDKQNDRIWSLATKFAETFMRNRYDEDYEKANNTQTQHGGFLNLGMYNYLFYDAIDIESIERNIYEKIIYHGMHPNDVCILSSSIEILRKLDFEIRTHERDIPMRTFEMQEDFDKVVGGISAVSINTSLKKTTIDNIRKQEKIKFNLNSGTVKMSTIHSFKGFETSNLFLIIGDNDNDELIYTAITRSKFNICVFVKRNSKYADFFQKELEAF